MHFWNIVVSLESWIWILSNCQFPQSLCSKISSHCVKWKRRTWRYFNVNDIRKPLQPPEYPFAQPFTAAQFNNKSSNCRRPSPPSLLSFPCLHLHISKTTKTCVERLGHKTRSKINQMILHELQNLGWYCLNLSKWHMKTIAMTIGGIVTDRLTVRLWRYDKLVASDCSYRLALMQSAVSASHGSFFKVRYILMLHTSRSLDESNS